MTEVSTKPAVIGEKLNWREMIDEALTMPGSMGNTYNRFYNYSLTNQIILYMQGVREPVNTFKRWNDMGRHVNKGAKAKAIVRPVMGKVKLEDGTEDTRLRGFKPVRCLFTVSDTNGDELPPVQPRTWDKTRALGELAITELPFTESNGNIQGYSFEQNVSVSPVAKYPVKTLFHEMGHVVLGHTAKDQMTEYASHRGIKEFQAESVAYLAMNELDLGEQMNPGESRNYVQTWLSGHEPADSEIRQVFTATDKILRAGWVEA